MANKKVNGSNGVIRKGMVIKDQGFVPYNPPESVSTPSVDKGEITKGTARGMGEAVRGGSFEIAQEFSMPYGLGTYGSKLGRPPKKKKKGEKRKKTVKKSIKKARRRNSS